MNYAHDAATIANAWRRDEARKQKVAAQFPHVVSAMDGNEFREASHAELCVKVLQHYGKPVPKDTDPAMALDFFMAGAQARSGTTRAASGMDGAPPEGSALARYLAGE